MDIIHKTFLYLIPGILETKINYANCQSNLSKYGVYSIIKQHRNFIYVTWFCGTILHLYNYKWFPIILITVQNGIYVNVIYKYRYFI